MAIVANMLVMRLFRHTTGVETLDGTTVLRVDAAGLSTSVHTFSAHPLALSATPRSAEQFREQIAQLEAGPEMSEADFSRASAALVDERIGILTSLGERDLEQVPLWVTQARTSDPVGLLAARGVSGVVHGAALDFTDARHRAARAALELYASAMLDSRLLHPAEEPRQGGRGALWGWRLDGGGPRLVPLMAVFDATSIDGASPLPAGVASANTWAAAVETGLLRCYETMAAADACVADAPFRSVDLDGAQLDETGRRLLEILRIARARVTAYDITGPLGVPAYALYLGDRAVAHTTGWTDADALRTGLERVALAHQAATAEQPDYWPPSVPALPAAVRGGCDLDSRARAPFLDHPDRVTQLAAAMTERGATPVAVPLDHDPALEPVLPYAVRVVIAP